MKTIILNGSPRKSANTAKLLKEAQRGAEAAGSDVEYIDLYDLNFTGCRSCLACKRKNEKRCHCFWKDDLSPIINRIFSADTLIIGSPIYLGYTTSQFHAFLERLHFVALSYDNYSNYFNGKVKVGVVLTMNVSSEFYENHYKSKLWEQLKYFKTLNGGVEVLPSCDTLQVNDYSKFNMGSFNEQHKKLVHETQFRMDLNNAFELGFRLSTPHK